MLPDPRHDIVEQMPLGGDLRVEFGTNLVGPPGSGSHRRNDRQAVTLECLRKWRLVDQSAEMDTVQIDHDESVCGGFIGCEDVAGMIGNVRFGPTGEKRHRHHRV
jgi:hypothetical protein